MMLTDFIDAASEKLSMKYYLMVKAILAEFRDRKGFGPTQVR